VTNSRPSAPTQHGRIPRLSHSYRNGESGYDILSPFGENAVAAAAVGGGNLLTDLLLLF
jgi:hypothetical protein